MATAPRKYAPIWQAIKAAKVGTEVPVKCHGTASATVRKAVIKEKSLETAERRKIGMPFAGPLEIREVSEGVQPRGFVILYFKLTWDSSRL